jgi:hypothetical protein
MVPRWQVPVGAALSGCAEVLKAALAVVHGMCRKPVGSRVGGGGTAVSSDE